MHVLDVIKDTKKWMSFIPYQAIIDDQRESFINDVIKLPPYEVREKLAIIFDL